MTDIRDRIFANLGERTFTAHITAERGGILAGVAAADRQAQQIGLRLDWACREGERLEPARPLVTVTGPAKAIAQGEERLLGCLSKASGIATAARRAVDLAAGRVRVVSGAWKKMPPALKQMVRRAAASGGMATRITDQPFIYLDKNYVRMLGGIKAALAAGPELAGIRVIQIRGEEGTIAAETEIACRNGAGILMVDTGHRPDAIAALQAAAPYPAVRIAFAGGIEHEDIPGLADLGLHILDIGAVIMDAPLLDMRLDVME